MKSGEILQIDTKYPFNHLLNTSSTDCLYCVLVSLQVQDITITRVPLCLYQSTQRANGLPAKYIFNNFALISTQSENPENSKQSKSENICNHRKLSKVKIITNNFITYILLVCLKTVLNILENLLIRLN